MSRLRGVLLGHGHMGHHHARQLRARDDVDLRIIDPAQGAGGPVPLDVDFAIIATPTATHAQVALPLLRAGVPCLVEKPLAATLAAARELATFPHLSVGHVERYNPVLSVLGPGRPRFFQAERLSPFPTTTPGSGARGTDTDIVRDLMIHDLDLFLHLAGDQVRDVRALGVGVMGTDRVDIANARVEVEGGVGTFTASRVSRTQRRSLRVVEEGVYWTLDLQARTAARVRWGAGVLDAEPVPVPDSDPLRAEHRAFLRAVRGLDPYPVSGPEALASMILAESILRSIESGLTALNIPRASS